MDYQTDRPCRYDNGELPTGDIKGPGKTGNSLDDKMFPRLSIISSFFVLDEK